MNEILTMTDAADALEWSGQVPLQAAGQRFDQVLAELLPDYSRSRLAAWIKSGAARLDGRQVKPGERVRGGERVALQARLETRSHDSAQPIALDLLYQDEHLLIVNKPAGLVVHPGAGNPDRTLVNALLHFDGRLQTLPRAGIVHRLDKDTSGALLVARSLPAHAALVEMLAERAIHRQYEAIVNGVMVAGGTVDAPLDRHPSDRLRRAVNERGRPAITHYRVRERYRAHSRIACQLQTGRTHQIRVHMAHIRFPLLGDPLYGGGLRLPKGASESLIAELRGFRRQALHAERLAFVHPITGEEVVAEAPRPADLSELIAALQADTASHAER